MVVNRLAFMLLALLLVHGEAPYSSSSHVTILGKYAPTATLCYTTSVKSNVFSLVPISRTVTFTPKVSDCYHQPSERVHNTHRVDRFLSQKSVSFVKVSSKTSPLLGARLHMGSLGNAPTNPISVALTTDFGGRLHAEVEAFC
uniref:Uncharacterized protein n=1 Tax=Anopheles albimanus TaxID=7167 RepID=A0A182FE81_ANOAL